MREGGREGGKDSAYTRIPRTCKWHIRRTSRQANQALVEIIDDVMRVHLFLRRPLPLAQRGPWDKGGALSIAGGDDGVGNRTCQRLEGKRRKRVPCGGGRRQGGVVRWWSRLLGVLLTGRRGTKARTGTFIHLAAAVAFHVHITRPCSKWHAPELLLRGGG